MAETTGFMEQGVVDDRQVGDGRGDEYQPPRLTPIGNARELLAGNTGSIMDVPTPLHPTQASG
jgi:hypothetical protein